MDWSQLFANGLMGAAMNGGQGGLMGMMNDTQGGNPGGLFGSLSGGPMNISPPAQGAFNPTQTGQINGAPATPGAPRNTDDVLSYAMGMMPKQGAAPMQQLQPMGMLGRMFR